MLSVEKQNIFRIRNL